MTTLDDENTGNLGPLLDDLESAAPRLSRFILASKVPAKRRQVVIKSTVERTTALLYQRGAIPDELARLVDLVTVRNYLDQASLSALIRNLYPATKVDNDAIFKVVGALGHGQLKPALPLQSLLLRWLVMVYHLLENPGILTQAYGTSAVPSPSADNTTLALSRQTGNDPPLTGLLRVFKNYYPEIIVGKATKGRASAFKHPDLQWRERLDEIQHQHHETRDNGGSRNGFSVNHALSQKMGAKPSLLPAVYTQHAHEDSVTLEEIDGPDTFVENLDKIELPTQLVAVLADPLLQKLLLLRPDSESFSRISNWVTACMGDVASGDGDLSLLLDIVDVVHDYTASTKVLPPLLLSFFSFLFSVWNGSDKRDVVLETLSFAPLMDFDKLYKSIFEPFEASVLDNAAESQTSLLKFYTLLLQRWTTIMQAAEDLDTLPGGAVTQLVTHVNKLTLTLSQTSPTTATYLTILDFYECSAAILAKPNLLQHVEITTPPALLVYIMHFSPSLIVVSRLCGLLAIYKRAFEALRAPLPTSQSRGLTQHENEQINTLNSFLMDICNCLWRGRAFATSDVNSQGCLIPQSLVPVLVRYLGRIDSKLSLGSVFGVSHSPVLSLRTISYIRELEDGEQEVIRDRHAGPVTQHSLGQLAHRGGLQISWQEYRSGLLRYLETKGFTGIPELMYNTMKNLMKARHQ
ncbi:Mis6-domain-containing protein [Apodospora peruviana]|uniref:Mis6-domain-containing protein n=1 Tax=Apodospora peruviana TaxID=516989 RepID=A0AAE0IK86_9PEZI|nr:Mis6-domain-containing protein [Apodospora peruviana]